jgi:hypothetical protein
MLITSLMSAGLASRPKTLYKANPRVKVHDHRIAINARESQGTYSLIAGNMA